MTNNQTQLCAQIGLKSQPHLISTGYILLGLFFHKQCHKFTLLLFLGCFFCDRFHRAGLLIMIMWKLLLATCFTDECNGCCEHFWTPELFKHVSPKGFGPGACYLFFFFFLCSLCHQPITPWQDGAEEDRAESAVAFNFRRGKGGKNLIETFSQWFAMWFDAGLSPLSQNR